MTDVLKNIEPPQLAAWYGRLAGKVDKEVTGKKGGVTVSLAAMLLRRWLDTKAGGAKFFFDPPEHLKSVIFVKETLQYHRRVYLTQEKARIGAKGTAREVWAGIVPRLEDGRWDGLGTLDMDYQSLVEVPVSVQLKALGGMAAGAELDLLYGLHGFQLRSDVSVTARPAAGSSKLAIRFTKFQALVRDRYDWDPTKKITVPNPDYRQSYAGAVEPQSENITVHHSNAKRLEKAGYANAFDLESRAWQVADPAISGPGEVDPT